MAKRTAVWVVGFVFALLLFQVVHPPVSEIELPYSEFKSQLQNGAVPAVEPGPEWIHGFLRRDGNVIHFRTRTQLDPNLRGDLKKYHVGILAKERPLGLVGKLARYAAMTVLLFVMLFLFLRGRKPALSA